MPFPVLARASTARSLAVAVALGPLAPSAPVPAHGLKVRSYASQVNDVDAVNSHWFETDEGVVLVDAQRILPEAERALEHLRASSDAPVVAIVVTHAHTDHYGGLPVWTEAFPAARVYLDRVTHRSIVADGRGFIDARRRRHGRRFASHEALREAVSDAIAIEDGSEIEIGGERLRFHVLGPSEAEAATVVELPDENVAFVGDLVNVGMPAVPFESLPSWLDQLDALEARLGDDALYQGHGPAPVDAKAIAEQRRFLVRLDELVRQAATDESISAAERESIVFALEAEWPFYAGVAGEDRRAILGFAVERVGKGLGVRVAGPTGEEG